MTRQEGQNQTPMSDSDALRTLGVAAFAAVPLLLASPAAAESSKEREPDTPIVEAPDKPAGTVFLGVDCTEPFMVGLADDVLTECECELTGR